jgi:Sec-independent protein secretion pathway component TatC
MFDNTTAMAISKTVLLTEFVNFVFLFLLAFGFVFEIPLLMVGLTKLGVVQPATWKGGWRYAVVGSLVFGAFITPDGSGVTELIVAVPMCALYGIGTGLSYAVARGARNQEMETQRSPATARRAAARRRRPSAPKQAPVKPPVSERPPAVAESS